MISAPRYVAAARWLHWIIALLILSAIVMGVWLTSFEPPDGALKDRLYNLHESVGVTIFVLALIRLLVRWSNPPPPLPRGTPGWVRGAAWLSHFSLYVLMLTMPLLGFLGNSAGGYTLSWFGVLPIPAPIGKDAALSDLLFTLHWAGALALGAVVSAHLLGTAYHVSVRRDRLLQRML